MFVINHADKQELTASFNQIAKQLLNQYVLVVNGTCFRIIDIEFYCYAKNDSLLHTDVYTHQHEHQLYRGRWYFHASGIGLTIGDAAQKHYGGILIRAVVELTEEGAIKKEAQIHGPRNVKRELCAHLHDAFDPTPNAFYLARLDGVSLPEFEDKTVYSTQRIGLKKKRDDQTGFHDALLRFVTFTDLKLKNKRQIAKDIYANGNYSTEEVNQLLGSSLLLELK